jgi:hypothetical protein
MSFTLLIIMSTTPLFASHHATGKALLNGTDTIPLQHTYGYTADGQDGESTMTVVFTDKPIPENWDLAQFESAAPSGVTAVVLRVNGDEAERLTLYHRSGTFTAASPKMSIEWSQSDEAAEGHVIVDTMTFGDGKTTLGLDVRFELGMQ